MPSRIARMLPVLAALSGCPQPSPPPPVNENPALLEEPNVKALQTRINGKLTTASKGAKGEPRPQGFHDGVHVQAYQQRSGHNPKEGPPPAATWIIQISKERPSNSDLDGFLRSAQRLSSIPEFQISRTDGEDTVRIKVSDNVDGIWRGETYICEKTEESVYCTTEDNPNPVSNLGTTALWETTTEAFEQFAH